MTLKESFPEVAAPAKVVTPAKDEVLELLVKARALIVKYGWAQHYYGSAYDGFCTVGALKAANPYDLLSHSDSITHGAYKAIQAYTGPRKAVQSWNDHPTRTKEEVLGVFDKVIEDRRSR